MLGMQRAERDLPRLEPRHVQLSFASSEQYLADLQAWVADACRSAIGASAAALIEALYGPCRPRAGVARWSTIGPHAILRREHQLSAAATSILLLAAAPILWGGFAYVYAAITGRREVDRHVLAVLHGDRAAVRRELGREAPLVASDLVSVRATGAVVASKHVVCRLAGN